MKRPYYPRRWHVTLTIIFLMVTFGLQLSAPESALASNVSFRGSYVFQSNYGSAATIGTSQPPVFGQASFEFLMSRQELSSEARFVQIGWSKQSGCGSATSVFAEIFNPDLGTGLSAYRNRCRQYFPQSDNDYYSEYNPATSAKYWCSGYNGIVIWCKYLGQNQGATLNEGWTGFATANRLVAYGETGHYSTSTPTVMGNTGQSLAVYITNIRYKTTGSNPSWGPVTMTGSSYSGCAFSPCPYQWRQGLAANTLYTYNWTSN